MPKFHVDLTSDNADTVEAGDRLPPDWYRAVLDDCFEDTKNENQTAFRWKVKGGAFDGRVQFDHLGNPDFLNDDKAVTAVTRRAKILGSRMGLIQPDAYGKEMDFDFADAISNEYVIQVVERKYQDKKTGEPKTINNVDFAGVYPLDHEKIPEDVRRKLQLPPARVKPGAAKDTPLFNGVAPGGNGAATPTAGATGPANVLDDL